MINTDVQTQIHMMMEVGAGNFGWVTLEKVKLAKIDKRAGGG